MIGQIVGNYKVVRKIGDGGMGSVYEAVHESIGRRVAIKVLRSIYSKDQTVVTRFFNEARAVNIVTHPGIVGSFDYGQLADGTAYIVMEYLEGETLSSRIKRLARPFGPDALRVGRQIASGLAAAHAKGIVHRDLKPDNVIIVPDSEAPGGERAKVLDFGIAKITSDSDASKPQDGLTQLGAVMGTPRYMSPEQCKGSATVDGKTDVYALGIILFHMLTAKLPFDAEGPGGVMAMHLYQPPPNPREIEPTIPPGVEALVLSMLAKKPEERPTMAEVVLNLEQIGARATSAHPALRSSASYPSLSGSQIPVPSDSSGPMISSRPSLAGVGQTQDPTSIQSGGAKLKRLAIPAIMATVLSGIGIAFVLRSSEPQQPQIQPRIAKVAAPKRIIWEVKSEPAGVEVVRVSDDVVVGLTPWRSEQAIGVGKTGMTLRRAGYMDKQVLLDREKDCSETVILDPIPSDDATSQRDPRITKPGKRPGKKSKEVKKNDDNDLAPVR